MTTDVYTGVHPNVDSSNVEYKINVTSWTRKAGEPPLTPRQTFDLFIYTGNTGIHSGLRAQPPATAKVHKYFRPAVKNASNYLFQQIV